MPEDRETYLGDGLFVSLDRFGTVWLRAPRDGGDHLVAMEPAVLAEFEAWLRRLRPQTIEADQR
jgi:hypothetical protein